MARESAAALAPHLMGPDGWGKMDMGRCARVGVGGGLPAVPRRGSEARPLLALPRLLGLDTSVPAPSARPSLRPVHARKRDLFRRRWAKFVAFLDSAGLLTDKVQSRSPGPRAATLDELRAPGGGGEKLPAPGAAALATNEFLP